MYRKLNKSSKSLFKEMQKDSFKKSRIPRLKYVSKGRTTKTLKNKNEHNNKNKEEKQYNLFSLLDIDDNTVTNKELMQYQIKLYNFLKQRKNLNKNSNVNTNEIYTNLNNEISPNESLHLFHQFTGYRYVDSPLKKMINSSPRNLDKCTNSYSIKNKNFRELKFNNLGTNNLINSYANNDYDSYLGNSNIINNSFYTNDSSTMPNSSVYHNSNARKRNYVRLIIIIIINFFLYELLYILNNHILFFFPISSYFYSHIYIQVSNNNTINENVSICEPNNTIATTEKNYIDENINNVKITSENNNTINEGIYI